MKSFLDDSSGEEQVSGTPASGVTPKRPGHQAELLKATLLVYARENEVDLAVERLTQAIPRHMGMARLWLQIAENRLLSAERARQAIRAKIRRENLQADGKRHLEVVR